MKLISKKEFMETPGPFAYIRHKVSNNIEVKLGVQDNQWFYQGLYDFADKNQEDGTDLETILYQKEKLEKGLSVHNQTYVKLSEEDEMDNKEFLIFELYDYQNMIIPLAECFDYLARPPITSLH